MKRPVLVVLSCTWLIACSNNHPPPLHLDLAPTPDLSQPPPDLARSPDLAVADMGPSIDLATPQCGHGQAYINGACACDTNHKTSCTATFCCSTQQMCIAADQCSPPPGRTNPAMGYDPMRARTLVFGGYDENLMPLQDQFELDAVTWDQQSPAKPPGPRGGAAMAFDGVKNVLLMMGGQVLGGTFTNETWAWDGTNWFLRAPAAKPPNRTKSAMVWDSVRQRIVLFGGDGDGDAALDDTWEWDGSNWQPKNIVGPDVREGHAMAYDMKNMKTVLFSGLANGTYSNDTWLYNGFQWVKQTTDALHTPPLRAYTAAAYDEARQNVVMFGGENPVDFAPQYNDTWLWDGGKWVQILPKTMPPGREAHTMVYDKGRKQVLMYGGMDNNGDFHDLWAWDGTNWTQLY